MPEGGVCARSVHVSAARVHAGQVPQLSVSCCERELLAFLPQEQASGHQ